MSVFKRKEALGFNKQDAVRIIDNLERLSTQSEKLSMLSGVTTDSLRNITESLRDQKEDIRKLSDQQMRLGDSQDDIKDRVRTPGNYRSHSYGL